MNLLEILGIEDTSETVPETKKCIICGEYKEATLDNFSMNMPNVLRNDCKKCKNKHDRERRALRKLYPKPKDIDYKCPICERVESDIKFTGSYGNKSIWRLDHSHDTGKARGWICDCCNRGLGGQGFSESVRALKNAIKYLEGSESELISKGRF